MYAFRSEVQRPKPPLLPTEMTASEICYNGGDISKLCRTCLCVTTDNDLSNESTCINLQGKLVRLWEIFEVATGLKIVPNDGLPHHLCSTCLMMLNYSYTIRMQSHRSDNIMRSVVLKRAQEKFVIKTETLDDVYVVTDREKSIDSSKQPSKPAEHYLPVENHQEIRKHNDGQIQNVNKESTGIEENKRLSGTAQKRFKWLLSLGLSEEDARLKEKKRLSGSGRKRFKYLLWKGLSEEEARRQALKPCYCKSKIREPQSSKWVMEVDKKW